MVQQCLCLAQTDDLQQAQAMTTHASEPSGHSNGIAMRISAAAVQACSEALRQRLKHTQMRLTRKATTLQQSMLFAKLLTAGTHPSPTEQPKELHAEVCILAFGTRHAHTVLLPCSQCLCFDGAWGQTWVMKVRCLVAAEVPSKDVGLDPWLGLESWLAFLAPPGEAGSMMQMLQPSG